MLESGSWDAPRDKKKDWIGPSLPMYPLHILPEYSAALLGGSDQRFAGPV